MTSAISQRGIEIDPSKIKTLQNVVSKNRKEVSVFVGRLNYIGCFITLTTICESRFKLLRKNMSVIRNEEHETTFEKIKTYLLNSLVLVPPVTGCPLLMYLAIHDLFVGCIIGQYDATTRKEQANYYLARNLPSMNLNIWISKKLVKL